MLLIHTLLEYLIWFSFVSIEMFWVGSFGYALTRQTFVSNPSPGSACLSMANVLRGYATYLEKLSVSVTPGATAPGSDSDQEEDSKED